MPIYEYHCCQCDGEVEILVRGSERIACPQCGSDRLEKQLSVLAAPSISAGSSLPVGGPSEPGNCGRPQCGSGGCMFGN